MSTKTATTKRDVYQDVTDQIIAQLETGVAPWHKPWKSATFSGNVSRPLRSTGERYQGINILMLWATSLDRGYDSPHWLTFKQAQAFKGHVRKGEKGTPVVYYSTFEKETDSGNGETSVAKIPFLKTYTVFNSQQCDGLPDQFNGTPAQHNEFERIAHADEFFTNTGADIRHGGNSAYYSPALDYVQMPPIETFDSAESHAATLAHELMHWTRHESRLNRTFNQKRFGDDGYAMEELVAEMGAAFLCADLGIEPEPREDHAAYLRSWLDVLKADKRAIFTAASYASKAVEHLHSLQPVAETVDA